MDQGQGTASQELAQSVRRAVAQLQPAQVQAMERAGVDPLELGKTVARAAFYAAVNEETTDALIGRAVRIVPGFGPLVLGPILDGLFPELLEELFEEGLSRI